MKIAIAADHAGFPLKQSLTGWLRECGHEVKDFGTANAESTDYPDYAAAVAREIASGEAERGVLICYTGIGMSIAANKVIGVRAAVATNDEAVRLTRSHNNANVLALGARFTELPDAKRLIETFLSAEFDGGTRHVRRISKIADIERAELTRIEEEQKQLYDA
jgi:ribose 5-phosphate isomerase B